MNVPAPTTEAPPTLLRLRAAMKFSLWAWAAYWPGFGVLLALRGMDPISVAVCGFAVAQLVVLWTLGALRTDPAYSRSFKRFLVERPIYFIAALVGILAFSSILGSLVSIGLAVFAGVQVAALGLVVVALRAHLKSTRQGYASSGGDQLLTAVVLCGIPAMAVFVDSFATAGVLDMSSAMVVLFNVVNLVFPALLLLAARPFREPLRLPKAQRGSVPVVRATKPIAAAPLE